MACVFVSPAAAQPKRAESVLVLEAANDASWEPGVQAIVAELLTTGYGLNVRVAQAMSLDQLEHELQLQVTDSAALAGVAVTRDGDNATAVLCRRGISDCERLRMKISEGELSRSRLALAVVQRLRPIDLPTAPEPSTVPKSEVSTAPVPRATQPARAVPASAAAIRPFRTWLSGGAVLSSGMSTPLTWLTASLAVMPDKRWGLELCFAGSPFASKVESDAGSLALHGLSASAFGSFDPMSRGPLGLSLGLGGGVLRLQQTATPGPGFDVSSHSPTVGLVSARARLFHRLGPVYLGLTIDPGLLVPAVKVETGAETAMRIGRPWVSTQVSVGVDL